MFVEIYSWYQLAEECPKSNLQDLEPTRSNMKNSGSPSSGTQVTTPRPGDSELKLHGIPGSGDNPLFLLTIGDFQHQPPQEIAGLS